MYGKIDKDGKFSLAAGLKKITYQDGKTIIEHYTEEELK